MIQRPATFSSRNSEDRIVAERRLPASGSKDWYTLQTTVAVFPLTEIWCGWILICCDFR